MDDRKPVIPRSRAIQDIEDAVAYYVSDAGQQTALRFVDALQRAFERIGQQPAAGSPRYAVELNVPGLRTRPVSRFSYLVFYVERADHVDVWRVLHNRRDIPTSMHDRPEP